MSYAVIVDLETTGLEPQTDEIIEIGLLEFRWQEGEEPQILRTYGGLQEPRQPLTETISQITGLRDNDLRGEAIDWAIVASIMQRSELIIAHNARFDRSFLEANPHYQKPSGRWACSQNHIAWGDHGFKTRALNYLACDQGFVNPFAHRAVFDCATTFRVIQSHLTELAATSKLKEFEFAAYGAPFEVKDTLKTRGYRWDPGRRVWAKRIFENKLEQERQFLEAEVYKGHARHQESAISEAHSL